MCGIVGYVGYRNAGEVLKKTLKRLEYRGYDSAGIAVITNGGISVEKRKGYVDYLNFTLEGNVGIGHTRWATHGAVEDRNAHPFLDCKKEFAIAHNGIIENFAELKKELTEKGHVFTSDTDSEVIAHLIEENYEGDFLKAFIKAISRLKGSYAIIAIHAGEKKILGAKNESPLVIGLGEGENFLASDIPAFLEYTNRVIPLDDGEICEITENSVKIYDLEGKEIKKNEEIVEWSAESAEKGGYEHFMLKEIHEQPIALENTLKYLLELEPNFEDFDRIIIVGCGTSYHAALAGKYLFEEIAEMPTEVYYASEYRYRKYFGDNALVILITQSGETADTLASARISKKFGMKTLAITNIKGSSITRITDETIYTYAGPEIGVAATKTFITQLSVLHYLAIKYGYDRGKIDSSEMNSLIYELRKTPRYVDRTLSMEDEIKEISEKIANKENMFYIGRGINYPIAMEGALKMKEISYIHAEAYPAGELKHGPLALVTNGTPVVALAPKDAAYDKMVGNIKEVNARGAWVIGVSNYPELKEFVDVLIKIPDTHPLFTIYPNIVVLQLLAYHTARLRGCEIDRPRNLAKSVTVE